MCGPTNDDDVIMLFSRDVLERQRVYDQHRTVVGGGGELLEVGRSQRAVRSHRLKRPVVIRRVVHVAVQTHGLQVNVARQTSCHIRASLIVNNVYTVTSRKSNATTELFIARFPIESRRAGVCVFLPSA